MPPAGGQQRRLGTRCGCTWTAPVCRARIRIEFAARDQRNGRSGLGVHWRSDRGGILCGGSRCGSQQPCDLRCGCTCRSRLWWTGSTRASDRGAGPVLTDPIRTAPAPVEISFSGSSAATAPAAYPVPSRPTTHLSQGITRPKLRTDGTVCWGMTATVSKEPASIREALHDSNWLTAMN